MHFDSERESSIERYETDYGELEERLIVGSRTVSSFAIGKKRLPKREGFKTRYSLTDQQAYQQDHKPNPSAAGRDLPREVSKGLRIDLLQELGEAAITGSESSPDIENTI